MEGVGNLIWGFESCYLVCVSVYALDEWCTNDCICLQRNYRSTALSSIAGNVSWAILKVKETHAD